MSSKPCLRSQELLKWLQLLQQSRWRLVQWHLQASFTVCVYPKQLQASFTVYVYPKQLQASCTLCVYPKQL